MFMSLAILGQDLDPQSPARLEVQSYDWIRPGVSAEVDVCGWFSALDCSPRSPTSLEVKKVHQSIDYAWRSNSIDI